MKPPVPGKEGRKTVLSTIFSGTRTKKLFQRRFFTDGLQPNCFDGKIERKGHGETVLEGLFAGK